MNISFSLCRFKISQNIKKIHKNNYVFSKMIRPLSFNKINRVDLISKNKKYNNKNKKNNNFSLKNRQTKKINTKTYKSKHQFLKKVFKIKYY